MNVNCGVVSNYQRKVKGEFFRQSACSMSFAFISQNG